MDPAQSTGRAGAPRARLHWPILLTSLPFAFLSFALPVYGKALGASAVEIGGLYSVVTAAMLLGRPIVGWALDRFGRRRFLLTGFVLHTVAMAVFALARTLAGFYVGRTIQGFASLLVWIAARTMVADLSAPEERGQSMGLLREADARGQVVGALIGFAALTSLSRALGWRLVFLGYAAMGLFGTWLGWRSVPETRPAATPAAPSSTRSGLGRLPRLLFVVLASAAAMAMLSPLLLVFLQDRFTADVRVLGLAFFPGGIVASVLSSRLGKLGDHIGRTQVIAGGLVMVGILLLVMPSLPSLALWALAYAVSSVGWTMEEPAEAALVADLTGGDVRGRGYGLHGLARDAAGTVAPLLGGWLYDSVGKAAPFYVSAIVLFVAALWAVAVLRPRK